MLIQPHPALHLTYCLNIHPGESWSENFAAIRDKACAVRDRLGCAGKPFGLGLRLGRQAAEELAGEGKLDELAAFLQGQHLYAFTINGFPYGPFHGTPVKQDVYRPDWRTPERLEYTKLLARILARLLPEGVGGSISTVPGSYKKWIRSAEDVEAMAANLCEAAAFLDELRRQTGKEIVLALEPEPDCYVETTPEAIAFFQNVLPAAGRRHLRRTRGWGGEESDRAIRRHLGVCLDLAHAAVEFEEPEESLRKLMAAGVKVAKVQISAALSAGPTPAAMEKLAEFRDEVYLHQVKVREAGGRIVSYPDLPMAMDDPMAREPGCQWRVHFHVPLFWGRYGELQSTSSLLSGAFWQCLRDGASPHLEIETYTFGVLPAAVRSADVVDNIVREYQWVLEKLGAGES